MRAAPAVQLDIETGAGWRRASWAVLLVAIAAVVAWAWTVNSAAGWGVAGLVIAHGAAVAVRVHRPLRARLGWDGAEWTLVEAGGAPPRRGEVVVALDVGDALLLRFAESPGAGWRGRWIALQRQPGLPWHALRCALYSPRPALAGQAA